MQAQVGEQLGTVEYLVTSGKSCQMKANETGLEPRSYVNVTMNQQAVLNDDQAVLGLFDKYCEL